jgi:hypothetical protein
MFIPVTMDTLSMRFWWVMIRLISMTGASLSSNGSEYYPGTWDMPYGTFVEINPLPSQKESGAIGWTQNFIVFYVDESVGF